MHADLNGVDQYLLNLGNPAARAWLADHISGLIEESRNRHLSSRRQHRPFELLGVWPTLRPAGHHRDTLHRGSIRLLGRAKSTSSGDWWWSAVPAATGAFDLETIIEPLTFGGATFPSTPQQTNAKCMHQSIHPVVGQRLQGGRQVRLPQRFLGPVEPVVGTLKRKTSRWSRPAATSPFSSESDPISPATTIPLRHIPPRKTSGLPTSSTGPILTRESSLPSGGPLAREVGCPCNWAA